MIDIKGLPEQHHPGRTECPGTAGDTTVIGTKRIAVPELIELVGRRSGTTRFVSKIDGIERFHAAAPVPGTAWTTLARIPTAPFDAEVARVTLKWVWICGLCSLTSLGIA